MSSFKKYFLYSNLLATVFFSLNGSDISAAETKKVEKPAAKVEKPVAPEQQVEKKAVNSITQGFIAKGTKTCADRIDQITNFIGTGATTGAILYFPASAPDKNLVSVSLEAVDKDKKSAYASANFAANGAGGCSAVYDAVTWWPDSCENVASKQFAEKKLIGKLKENINMVEIDKNARAYLLPTKDGCVSIKKEIVSQ